MIRARGGREAEREERQLWETPERKKSTKQVANGETLNIDVRFFDCETILLDLMLARRNYLSENGESHADIEETENELNRDEIEHPELFGEPINGDNAEPEEFEEQENDQPPPLEEMEEEIIVTEPTKEDQGYYSN